MKQMIPLWRSTSTSDVEGNFRNDSADLRRAYLEHAVVVRIFRLYCPLIQILIVEEGGIIPRETVQP